MLLVVRVHARRLEALLGRGCLNPQAWCLPANLFPPCTSRTPLTALRFLTATPVPVWVPSGGPAAAAHARQQGPVQRAGCGAPHGLLLQPQPAPAGLPAVQGRRVCVVGAGVPEGRLVREQPRTALRVFCCVCECVWRVPDGVLCARVWFSRERAEGAHSMVLEQHQRRGSLPEWSSIDCPAPLTGADHAMLCSSLGLAPNG